MRLSLKIAVTCVAVAVVEGHRRPNSFSTASHAAFLGPSGGCHCSGKQRHGVVGSTTTCRTPSSTFVVSPRDSGDATNDIGSSPSRGRKRKAVREAIAGIRKTVSSAVRPTSTTSEPVIKDDAKNATEYAADVPLNSTPDQIEGSGERSRDQRSRYSRAVEKVEDGCAIEAEATAALDALAVAKTAVADAFDAAESEIGDSKALLDEARRGLSTAKMEAASALSAAESAALEALTVARKATIVATAMANEEGVSAPAVASQLIEDDAMVLGYDDVDYHLSEMAPPFIDEDQCLVPGEALVRVEKAPENSRRIFAGIDIIASVETVWNVLTDYEHLQKVVPNLSVNEVLALYDGDDQYPSSSIDPSLSDEVQCEKISKHMRGAKLRQVGSAKVVGINFSAKTTLEVREWPEGMPDFAHFDDELYDGKTRKKRLRENKKMNLRRFRFPRPFALTKLRHRDISMQSVEDDDGEFRLYQGVWRMQPLPGCAPEGGSAMRLTYAVEISPRPYLPVALVEGRITTDLCNNLKTIRSYVQGESEEKT